jgi:hypothetical protein
MGDRDEAAEILLQVMGDERFRGTEYLDWLYGDQPIGTTVEVVVRDDAGRPVAHGAAIPQELRRDDREARFVEIVNAAVIPNSQGQNIFASEILNHVPFVLAQNCVGGFGVTNERSTVPGVSMDGLGATLVRPLPVKLCAPSWRRPAARTIDVTPSFRASAEFDELTADLDDFPVTDWVQRFTPDVLRWRLARPNVTYALHVTGNVVGVSLRAEAKGMPIALILKLLPRGGSRGPLPSQEIITAACRHHRAPIAVYAGFNAHVPVRGFDVPRRYLPKPLNLLFLTLSELDPADFRFDTFEFLDFDAF